MRKGKIMNLGWKCKETVVTGARPPEFSMAFVIPDEFLSPFKSAREIRAVHSTLSVSNTEH